MHIESGPSAQRRNSLALWLAGFLGIAAWFAYDGWIGWPSANAQERARSLPAEATASPSVDERVSEELAGKTYDEVRAAVGGARPLQLGDAARFDGPHGYLLIGTKAGERAQWKPLRKSAHDLLQQKFLAGAAAVVAVGAAFRLARVMKTRIGLDDAGLHTHRGLFIAWNRMSRLDSDRLADKGWVELEYENGGRPARLRLDRYELGRFEDIVDGICDHREWPNPLGPRDTTSPPGAAPA